VKENVPVLDADSDFENCIVIVGSDGVTLSELLWNSVRVWVRDELGCSEIVADIDEEKVHELLVLED